MTTKTLAGGGVAGKATRRPRVRPPHMTDSSFWLAYVLLLTAVLAVLPH